MRTRLATVLVALAANQVALPVATAMSHVGTSPLYPAAAEPGELKLADSKVPANSA